MGNRLQFSWSRKERLTRMNKIEESTRPVKLRGVGDGFRLTLLPDHPFEELEKEIVTVFDRLRQLARGARVEIDTGDGGNMALVTRIGEFLKEKYAVGSVSEASEKPAKAEPAEEVAAPEIKRAESPEKRSSLEARVRKRDVDKSWEHRKSDVTMLAGRVRSGQKVSARKHVLILGDVNPGAEIIAGGDIIVMGRLCGTAIAGHPGNEEAIILALDFRPTQVQIGGCVAAGFPSTPSEKAEFAHVEEGGIVVDDYLGKNPFSRMPWPKAR